jgi:hypothetical protein
MLRSLRGSPTALITHSQNSRMHWPWLQDGRTMRDLMKTGHAPASSLDPDLRLIRIRGAAGRETPQWWGNAGPDRVNGLPPGLWAETETEDPDSASGQIFYSTTAKASTFRDSAVEANKLATRPLRQGKNRGEPTIDTHIPAWNPGLVEIAILGCHPEEGDDSKAFALVMHQLRQAPDYMDALSMPLPLHLAALAHAYVLPTVAEGDGDEEAEAQGEEVNADEEDHTDRAKTALANTIGTDLVTALGLDIGGPDEDEADLAPELPDAPGLARAPDEPAALSREAQPSGARPGS